GLMRAFTAAAVQLAPVPGPLSPAAVRANVDKCVDVTRRCVADTGAELVVLPESATTGFTPDCSTEQLWDLMSELPGPVVEPLQDVAGELGIHLCVGTYERGAERGVVHNSAALIGPSGDVLGVYRKTHPFCSEIASGGGWVTPGDTVTVCDTELGRIGMMICFDGDYPELARIQAVRGAEVICRPSALLRSADIWELTSRARAYDNHVYVIGANATGVDPAGVLYFGNSHVVTPLGHIVAKAATHEGWVSARLDPDEALRSLTPGSNVGQGFDHLRDRNLDLIRNHREDLERPARTSFPHEGGSDAPR
ncbi:MAG TPA: carbon-nitrogen hydrolase family protein, partial [Intrasporangium sp.]|uniref:carbon-nitrogen hydrolase family protein n=1 Tax=Intrasporangium sp. TaxID=1925024 RepID=UPI002D76B235